LDCGLFERQTTIDSTIDSTVRFDKKKPGETYCFNAYGSYDVNKHRSLSMPYIHRYSLLGGVYKKHRIRLILHQFHSPPWWHHCRSHNSHCRVSGFRTSGCFLLLYLSLLRNQDDTVCPKSNCLYIQHILQSTVLAYKGFAVAYVRSLRR
jgi:hypothetical protein